MSTGIEAKAVGREKVAPAAFDFVELMAERAERLRGRPKRVRTRAKILAAAAQELALKGYEGLTVDGVCAGAEMARGTFYLYYSDRAQIAITLYRMFWTAVYRKRPRLRGKGLDERVRVTNAFYLELYARNATFLAAQASLSRDRTDFRHWHDQMNHRWSLIIAANIPGSLPSEEKVLRARALVAMADELLANIFTARTPTLRHWADHPDRLADVLSAIWTRVVVDDAKI